ncbi:carboxymuconolactone decarboxylase family protein [Leminorella grimontii]|uniref:carboxymuconolactone decarboxylase family protein n=1 Tax=Leminorella grimontii TaxID=82981 RepID=UPI0020830E7B|nr:carboxymuconolactone decarboxylase family protein [Leminorella grimontii]GKX59653.1 hypothetical protein SOASR031_19680 [Leminorella grimontii]
MTRSLDRDTLQQLAPKLAQLTQDILFGDLWQRTALTPRERSLVTLAALTAMGKTRQLPWHIEFAQQNGIRLDEMVEVFTHLAFYAGWPAAVSALECLPEEER